MKRILLLALPTLMLFSCKKESKTTDISAYSLNQYRNKHQITAQQFQADAANGSSFVTAKGIWVKVPAGAFTTLAGTAVTSGTINIAITEYFNSADMIFGKVSTVASNNTVLLTGGMFNITATQNNQELKLKLGQTLRVAIPAPVNNDPDMLIFKGQEIADVPNRVEWREADPKWAPLDTPIGSNTHFYDFMINDLKWWNLDKYHDLGNGRTKMSATLPSDFSNKNAFICLVMPNNGAVHLAPDGSVSQVFTTGNYTIPIGIQVKVLSVGTQNDQLYFNISGPVTVTSNMNVTVPGLATATDEQVTNAIKGL